MRIYDGNLQGEMCFDLGDLFSAKQPILLRHSFPVFALRQR